MPSSTTSQFSQDREIWDSLKQAITTSSGFQRWQQQQVLDDQFHKRSLDDQIRRYLRETLETLAY